MSLSFEFPAIPTVVQEARAVLARERLAGIYGWLAGVGLPALVGAGYAWATGEFALPMMAISITFGGLPIGFAFYSWHRRRIVELVQDARAVELAWDARRADWAEAMIMGSIVDAHEEVRAWSEITAGAKKLALRAG